MIAYDGWDGEYPKIDPILIYLKDLCPNKL